LTLFANAFISHLSAPIWGAALSIYTPKPVNVLIKGNQIVILWFQMNFDLAPHQSIIRGCIQQDFEPTALQRARWVWTKRNWVLVAALGLVSSFSAVALSWGGEQSAIKPQQITSPRDEDAASGGNAGPDNEQPEAADDLTSVLKQIEAAIGDLKPREDGDERQEQEDRDKRDLTA